MKNKHLPSPGLKRVYDSDKHYYLSEKYHLKFYSDHLDKEVEFHIPKHFIVDGASIPRFFWRLVSHPLNPRYWVAFVVHDYLYGNSLLNIWEQNLSRHDVDELFYEMLRAEGVGWTVANTMHKAVRSGGWTSFRKNNNKFATKDQL